MKKLLLIAIVAMGFAHEAGAMIFKKSEYGKSMPVFRPIIEPNNFDVLDKIQEPLLDKLAVVESLENEEQKKVAKKDIIKLWCDEFKQNSKKLAIWTEGNKGENKEDIAGCCIIKTDSYNITCLGLNLEYEIEKLNSKNWFYSQSDLEFKKSIIQVQRDEWFKWHEQCSEGKDFGKTSLILVMYREAGFFSKRTEQFLSFTASPYYKKVKLSEIYTSNELENSAYHEALHSLLITKKAMEHNLNLAKHNLNLAEYNLENPSLLQKIKKTIWSRDAQEKHDKSLCEHKNYQESIENYQESINVLSDEIASFKDQDKIVSKRTTWDGKEILLSRRDVFTKSSTPRSLFEELKRARE